MASESGVELPQPHDIYDPHPTNENDRASSEPNGCGTTIIGRRLLVRSTFESLQYGLLCVIKFSTTCSFFFRATDA
ncbi:unnamed protein product [Protopolystoma xenopodis]|uniref:Uncharacterized protein n=1 Tax=Protopolystoma xenopodis TaxID=117903 RepID=A0A3S5FCT7_9PLAT|nr:unnamed protein product [Protopolystoma xenopodis]